MGCFKKQSSLWSLLSAHFQRRTNDRHIQRIQSWISSTDFKQLQKSRMTCQRNEASQIKRKKKNLCWQSHTVAYLPRTLCRMDCLLLSKAQGAIKRCRLCSPADPLLECVLFSTSQVRMIVICDKTAQARWRVGQECVWRLKRETRLEGRVAQMLLVYSWLKLLQLHFQNHKASLSTEL